jgi:hypothetical protein
MSVCVTVCVCVCVCVVVCEVRACVCKWRGDFNRVVLVVQLCLIFHFILNPEQRRVFQLGFNIRRHQPSLRHVSHHDDVAVTK